MPADRQSPQGRATRPMLVEAGDWILNLWYLISTRKVGKPDPRSEVEVTMESGEKIRLKGEAAEGFLSQVESLISRERSAPVAATPTKILRGRGLKPG